MNDRRLGGAICPSSGPRLGCAWTTAIRIAAVTPSSRALAVAAALCASGGSLFAAELDLSNRSDPAAVYNVAFCGRPSPDSTGKPGHAFVAFSRKPHGGERDFLAIGHTVAASTGAVEATWSYFGEPVPGLLKEELYTSVQQNCLDVTVNKEDYEAARSLTVSPLETMGVIPAGTPVFEAYKLGESDCMTFVMAVAGVLEPRGLRIPDRGATEFPMAYIQRLIDDNPGP